MDNMEIPRSPEHAVIVTIIVPSAVALWTANVQVARFSTPFNIFYKAPPVCPNAELGTSKILLQKPANLVQVPPVALPVILPLINACHVPWRLDFIYKEPTVCLAQAVYQAPMRIVIPWLVRLVILSARLVRARTPRPSAHPVNLLISGTQRITNVCKLGIVRQILMKIILYMSASRVLFVRLARAHLLFVWLVIWMVELI